ncbi:MAG TPA: penicillin-binding transpeptidase domain-containing protein [Candidatus Paceibacterota bacterium]
MLSKIKKKILSTFSGKKYSFIYPDEVFLDSRNLPDFDKHQFEGRIERPILFRSFVSFYVICFVAVLFFVYTLWDLGISKGKVYAEISQNNSLRHDPILAPRGVIYDRNGKILVSNSIVEESEDFPRRIYLEKFGFSHLLGFIKYPAKDSSGFYFREEYEPQDGVEILFNEVLAGRNGLKISENDVSGNLVSESLIDPSLAGDSLQLAVDLRIQEKMYQEIKSLSERVGFLGGAGIIMDVNSGEILTLTSYPEYDSQLMTDGQASSTIRTYSTDNAKPFLNRIISGLYTPGSVVKPFLAFGALEEGVISPEKEIVSTGKLVVPNPYFPDQPSIFLDWKAHGAVDMRKAIAVSSNVYFYEVGGGFASQKGLGIEKIEKYFRKFGLSQLTGVGTLDEAVGNIPNPEWKEKNFPGEPWRLGDTYNTAIGQYGMQVTPLQIVRAIAAIANGGVLVTPGFEKKATTSVPIGQRISGKEEHYQIIREGMRMSVTLGTSKGLDMSSVAIAGKTGTAQLGTSKSFVNSWTTGFFPYENPRYAYLVVMEHGPSTNLTGATFVMRQVMDFMVANTPEYLK